MECRKKGGIMVEPLIFIGTYTLKEGQLEGFKKYAQEHAEFVEENEPRLIHFEQYINEDGTEVSFVQVHPDEDSMAFHMQLIREHIAQAFEFLDAAKSYEVYGTPSDTFVEQLKQTSGPEVPVIVKSKLAGFNRLPATGVTEPTT
jgi:quinol monooxygenase YgiN